MGVKRPAGGGHGGFSVTKRASRVLVAVGTAIAVVGAAWAQSGRPASPAGRAKIAAPSGATSQTAVAKVGGLAISRTAFDERVRMAERIYREESSAGIPSELLPVVRRQVLERMIREKLLALEARRRGMSLSAEQAEEELKKNPFFHANGLFDEAKFMAVKAAQPDRFRSAIADLQVTLPAIRLRDKLQRESLPDSAAMHARISRELSRVIIEYLALRRSDFAGDGSEPAESEILDHYRRHAADFRLPEQVRLSVLVVDQPPLADTLRADEKSVRAWEARMRQRADSLLATVKRGAPLEGGAPRFGGLHSEWVERNRFPGYWGAGERARDAVFASPAGTLLPESLTGSHGGLIVRVDEHLQARTAPIRDVAGQIRATLRSGHAADEEDRELRALYASIGDGLRGNGFRIRYAIADSAGFLVPEPTRAELDRYYRGHQANYATLDPATSAVITLPFAEVRDDVHNRVMRQRRATAARDAAERLLAAWSQGRRDPHLERLMALNRDVGPIPAGSVVDSGAAGQVLTDSLAARPGQRTIFCEIPRGWLTAHVYETVRDFTPAFEVSRPMLIERRTARRSAAETAEARALFDVRPERFGTGGIVRFSRLMVPLPTVYDVPLSRDEVEGWYRSHLEVYGVPELVRIRHILISPADGDAAADRAARQRADGVMERLRAGEDFATLALRYSDDETTKRNGGDVGVFGRGTMLDEFERVAFAMQPGELRGPVRTEVGYHLMECIEHLPAEVAPLKYCYTNAAVDAARSKSKQIARFRADSLLRVMKSVPQARTIAVRTGFPVYHNDQEIGGWITAPADIREYIQRLEKMKAGQIYPAPQQYEGMGFAVTWMDSVLPPGTATWETARARALDFYRDEKARRKMQAKRAELDSLFRSGWSLDSVAALWGGPETHGPATSGRPIERMDGTGLLDSLAFGTGDRGPALKLGKETEWIEFPGGIARLRLIERRAADPLDLATRLENDRKLVMERSSQAAFDQIRRHFPVEILDHDLRLTEIPRLESE